MATFQQRVKQLMPDGYVSVMRRSVQTVILFEAQRCVREKLAGMRPFQRKIAHYNQLLALLQTLDFIPPNDRKEVLWRTFTSKDPINEEVAWKRSRTTEKDLAKLSERAKSVLEENERMTHSEVCDKIIQDQYESLLKLELKESGKNSETKTETNNEPPVLWEHSHNHLMMAYRMYYKGDRLDPDFPPPKPPIAIVVPSERPQAGDKSHLLEVPTAGDATAAETTTTTGSVQPSQSPGNSGSERQRILTEVREHLDLLKEFEGVIPQEELNERKRELFLALPPAPPANGAKRLKTEPAL